MNKGKFYLSRWNRLYLFHMYVLWLIGASCNVDASQGVEISMGSHVVVGVAGNRKIAGDEVLYSYPKNTVVAQLRSDVSEYDTEALKRIFPGIETRKERE